MVVKRRDALGVGTGPSEDRGAALDFLSLDPGEASAKKKKKLRIRPGVVSGSRVVFDDDGEAKDPLELLAERQPDRHVHPQSHLEPSYLRWLMFSPLCAVRCPMLDQGCG